MSGRFDLEGRVAIVTGASQGIGLGIAGALAEAGAAVVAAARRPELLQQAVEVLQARGARAVGVACDVRDGNQARRLAERAVESFGRVDILVNNVGASYGDDFRRGPLLEMTPADLDGAIRQNVTSLLHCCWAVVPGMLQRSGSIINVASVVVSHPMPGFGLYAAAKAAVVSLTRTMALEWAPRVRVNALLVGHVDTPRASSRRTAEDRAWLERHIALGRLGTPEDVGSAALYLVSDAAAWTTGAAVEVDGGVRSLEARQPPARP
jgi:NAD(P)-dependent dehydrogenase (short-subunit alcohol dehydrogenase family)